MKVDGNIRSAMGTIIEAMRAGFGPQRIDPQTLPDSGHDPHFIERAAPVLEFLYGKYFRVRTLGLRTSPKRARRCWSPTTRAACPTTGPC